MDLNIRKMTNHPPSTDPTRIMISIIKRKDGKRKLNAFSIFFTEDVVSKKNCIFWIR